MHRWVTRCRVNRTRTTTTMPYAILWPSAMPISSRATAIGLASEPRSRARLTLFALAALGPLRNFFQTFHALSQRLLLLHHLTLRQASRTRLYPGAGRRIGAAKELHAIFIDDLVTRALHFLDILVVDSHLMGHRGFGRGSWGSTPRHRNRGNKNCLLYTSDAADDLLCVD